MSIKIRRLNQFENMRHIQIRRLSQYSIVHEVKVEEIAFMSAFGGKADIEGKGARRLRGALRGAEVIDSLMIEPLENFETWLMIWTAANVVSFREGGAFK